MSTWAQRETVAYVICHEIVHQWLGNLVTTTWWNTTWLNEGVTSFYHYYFVDKVGLASSPGSFRTIYDVNSRPFSTHVTAKNTHNQATILETGSKYKSLDLTVRQTDRQTDEILHGKVKTETSVCSINCYRHDPNFCESGYLLKYLRNGRHFEWGEK